jgi:plastocyanin
VESLEGRALLATANVTVQDFSFNPNPVTIHVGDTVHWVWVNGMHSTTSAAGSIETWNSGVQMTAGFTFDHTFTHAGTFNYYCTVHGQDLGNGRVGGMSGTITVLPPATLSSIMVMPANPGIAVGGTEQFTAMGVYSDQSTQDLTSQVTWASTNTGVATISNTPGSQGRATGLAPGTSTIRATLNDRTGSTGLTVSPAPTAPTVTGEHVALTFLKHNKRGKPIGQPVVSFVFDYSTAMNPGTAGNEGNYQVAWASTKRVKRQTVTVLHPVRVTPTFDASSNSVTLLTSAMPKTFSKGGVITINAAPPSGVSSAAGAFLAAPTRFNVFARASGLAPIG